MGAPNMRSVGWIISVMVTLSACALAEEPSSQPLSDQDKADIRTYVRDIEEKPQGEGSQLLSHRYGARAVPVLVELLGEVEKPAALAELHLLVGRLGKHDDTVVAALLEYIERPLPDEMTRDQVLALDYALVGIGLAATDKGLDFLQKAMTEEYWLGRKDWPTAVEGGTGAAQTRMHFRQMAFNGFCDSKTQRAYEALRTWRDLPEDFRYQQETELKAYESVQGAEGQQKANEVK